MAIDREAVERHVRALIHALGEDGDRDGLRDTPARVARFWAEFLDYDPGIVDTSFQHTHTDQLVVVSGMRVWSMCEHHLVPFWCEVAVGYVANGTVLGLSKFARVAQRHAHRLQMQERLVEGMADELCALVGPDVAVLASGEHLCVSMRGVRTPAVMTTSVMRGSFREDRALREEFMGLVQRRTEGLR